MIWIKQKQLVVVGRIFEALSQLPLIGEPWLRWVTRSSGKMVFYSPLYPFKREKTIGGVREKLETMCEGIGIPISVIKEEEDRLEFIVHECPYEYHRADQQVVCDAAMDLDRTLFKLCGADLTIEESVVCGAKECRILLKMI